MTIPKGIGLLLGVAATLYLAPEAWTSDQTPPADVRTDEEYQRALEAAGWTPAAARAVVANQADYWRLLDENGREEVDNLFGTLYARFRDHDRWLKKLESRPEYAGLLAGLFEIDGDGPDVFLDGLNSIRGHDATVDSLYQFGPRPKEALETAQLLKEEGALIPKLVERDALDLIGLFQPDRPPHDPEARRIYRRWARRLAERGLDSPDKRLDRIQAVLLIHATTVANRLDEDVDFRQRFEDIAPLAESVLLKDGDDDLDWGVRAGAPAIWAYLQAYGEQGRQWFESQGTVAVDLLAAPEYRSVRKKVEEAVKSGDEATMAALLDDDLRSRPAFINLLERCLSAGTLAKALANLRADPKNAASLLDRYARLSDAALTKDLGPPPSGPLTWLPGYSLYELADKIHDGRDVGVFDVAFAAADAGEAIFMLKGGTKTLKAIVRAAVEDGATQRGAVAVARATTTTTERQLLPWMVKESGAATRTVMKELTERAAKAMTVDATKAVQLAFKGSGVGRDTFKKLTDLDARIFMRTDRRLFIDFSSTLAKDHVLGRYLRMTAVNGGVIEGAGVVLPAGAKALKPAAAQLDAWRKHVGAWWLANANRTLDRMAAPAAAAH